MAAAPDDIDDDALDDMLSETPSAPAWRSRGWNTGEALNIKMAVSFVAACTFDATLFGKAVV